MKPIVGICAAWALVAGCSHAPRVVGPPANVAGNRAYEAGDFAEALVHYEAHLSQHPDDTFALYRTGNCLDALGDPEGAIEAHSRCLQRMPGDRQALLARAHAYYAAREFEPALADVNAATRSAGFEEAQPRERVVALGLLAQIAHAGGEVSVALEALDRAIDEARAHEGHVSGRMRRTLLHNRSATLYALGYYSAARDDFEEYLALSRELGSPIEENDHYNGCLVNYMAEDFRRAREYFPQVGLAGRAVLAEETHDQAFFVAADAEELFAKGGERR